MGLHASARRLASEVVAITHRSSLAIQAPIKISPANLYAKIVKLENFLARVEAIIAHAVH